MDYITKLANDKPALSESCNKMGDLFNRKLWHQLTLECLIFMNNSDVIMENKLDLKDFYDQFLCQWEGKMNQLKFAQLIATVGKQMTSHEDSLTFVTSMLDSKRARLGDEAGLFLEMEKASLMLKLAIDDSSSSSSSSSSDSDSSKGKSKKDEIETMLKSGKLLLDSFTTSDTIVFSAYYSTAQEFYKLYGPPEKFYKNALMYLAYTPIESLSSQVKFNLATDMSLAAITGDGVYNFGEVLATPILEALHGTENAWLSDMLQCFNNGDVDKFCMLASDIHYQSHAALTSRPDFVKQKVVLMSLMNLIFERPAHGRTISFMEIAERTRLELDKIEWLLMRAMSLGLIKGVMDEVEQKMYVKWVQPRVLDGEQQKQLSSRLQEWGKKVKEMHIYMDDLTPELFN